MKIKNQNPNRKIKVTEAEYARGRRDRERIIKIKKALRPVNQILKNLKIK